MPRDESRKTSIWISRAQKARDLQENKRHVTLHCSLFKGSKSPHGTKAIKYFRKIPGCEINWKKTLLRCMGAKCKHLCRRQLENIIIRTSVGTGAVTVAYELHVLVPDPRQKGCPAADGVVRNPRRGISWHPAMPPTGSVCQRARNVCQRWQDCFSLSVAETGTQPY